MSSSSATANYSQDQSQHHIPTATLTNLDDDVNGDELELGDAERVRVGVAGSAGGDADVDLEAGLKNEDKRGHDQQYPDSKPPPTDNTKEKSDGYTDSSSEPTNEKASPEPDPASEFLITHEWVHLPDYKDAEKALVERLYVDFHPTDARNPMNFSYRRKWAMTTVACLLTMMAAYIGPSYAMGYGSMTTALNCTQFQATIGLSVYALGFAVVPLFSAALSEEFGRQPLYIVSTLVFMLMQLAVALAKNIQSVIIFRFIAGGAGSTGSTMVGGSVADIWSPSERGVPMAVFSLMAIGATGLGPVVSGWVELNPKLGYKWIAWIPFIILGVILVSIPICMKESRTGVLLSRHAKALRRSTGDQRYRARVEDTRPTMRDLLWVSCTRPLHLLTTEPVVISFSLWIGFAWGILYSLVESIAPAFSQLHGFNVGLTGTAFATMIIGAILGFATNFYQEHLYHRYVKVRGEEARLYLACVAGILFPIGMFIYAWTSFPNVSWVGMAAGLVVFVWACFTMYLAVFTYLADCYGIYASSALAGQSLARNIAGTAFPLFTTQMFDRLTFKWSSFLFGCIALLMAPIPFVLFFWGPRIRAKSRFAKAVPGFGQ